LFDGLNFHDCDEEEAMPDVERSLIILGCIGGLIPDVLRLIRARYQGLPAYFKQPSFWLGLVFLVAVGGLAAWIGEAQDAKQALAYGFGAPEVISRFLSSTPEQPAFRSAEEFSLRRWWAV
jgi:hypothetical protein